MRFKFAGCVPNRLRPDCHCRQQPQAVLQLLQGNPALQDSIPLIINKTIEVLGSSAASEFPLVWVR